MLSFQEHPGNALLLIGVFLISLLSFALGFIVAKKINKEPIKIEYHYEETESGYCWSGNKRSLFSS